MRDDMEEYIKALPRQNDLTFASEIPRIESDVIRFYLSARGLGDAITGLYAACGLANAGHEVEFYTNKHEWLRVSHPGVQILKGEDGFDANANYRAQMSECRTNGMTRCDWYLKNIATAYGIKQCKAARPKEVYGYPSLIDGEYVLLAPFSMSVPRSWLPAHYRRLAILLKKQGIQVAAIADAIHRKRCVEIFYGLDVKQFIDLKPDQMISLVQHAMCTVGNDSGPAHVAGLYGKKTVVVTSQFRPEYVFECANNLMGMSPKTNCVFCHEQDDGGFDQFCIDSCSALQLIAPEDVIRTVTNVPNLGTTIPIVSAAEMAAVVFSKRTKSEETNLGHEEPQRGIKAPLAKAKGASQGKGKVGRTSVSQPG